MRVGAPFEVAHDFFRKLTSAWRNAAHAPSYDFFRLNNKSLTKGARAVSASIESLDEESLRNDIKNLMGKAVGGDTRRATRRGGIRSCRVRPVRRWGFENPSVFCFMELP